MNVLDLFSGIGGFSLGLERAGMRTIAFCEIDPYCQAVLRKHWPDVPIFTDVQTVSFDQGRSLADPNGGELRDKPRWWIGSNWPGTSLTRYSSPYRIDVICGGFPCQDISIAGKGAGIEGARSGLWSEFARIIGEVRPRYVIVENVAALRGRGIERVLGDLAALGFDCEWHCIPASAVGAPHRRDRVWIVAHSQQSRLEGRSGGSLSKSWGASIKFACGNQWQFEPDVGRVANGVPFRVDRLRSLGNAIVPQIAEIIGKAIMAQGT